MKKKLDAEKKKRAEIEQAKQEVRKNRLEEKLRSLD